MVVKPSAQSLAHTRFSTMPFNFQAIQTLRITADDHPNIDVQDGNLVLTATRGEDQIMITAPINSVIPTAKAAAVKKPQSRFRKPRPLAKLNADLVREIRARAADRDFIGQFNSINAAYTQLSKDYGVHLTTIYGIIRRYSWKNV